MTRLSRRAFTAGASSALMLGVAGCTAHQTGPATGLADVPPSYRPDINSDEAGLWMQSDASEQQAKTAANRIRDKAVTDMVNDCLCRIAGPHCPDLRAYVLRVPAFNAFAAPNGMIQVWSGLLLRARNESHLAMILGHEFAHFRRRHSLQRFRDMRAKNDLATFMGLGMAMAGLPQDGNNLARLFMQYSISAFSREHEREADALGLEMAVRAGYDPFAASAVWKGILDESEAGDEPEEKFDLFLSTHPMSKERMETLEKLAREQRRNGPPAPDRLRDALAPIRGQLLADQVNLGHFKRSLWLFDRLLADGHAPGEVLFHKGELYRRRARDGDAEIALGFYHEACEAAGAPPEAFRMVGLVRWRKNEKEAAREYFRRYLHVAPDARDREMIKSYLAGA